MRQWALLAFLVNKSVQEALGTAFLKKRLGVYSQAGDMTLFSLFMNQTQLDYRIVLRGAACSQRATDVFRFLLPKVEAEDAFFQELLYFTASHGATEIVAILMAEKRLEEPMLHTARPAGIFVKFLAEEEKVG